LHLRGRRDFETSATRFLNFNSVNTSTMVEPSSIDPHPPVLVGASLVESSNHYEEDNVPLAPTSTGGRRQNMRRGELAELLHDIAVAIDEPLFM
jgi:hypothetical protein